ncbi:glycosyltransferase family 4 protein [uncultured Desulfosarcina sp.]|uniref:glycosyltransferase family 4 protein n=1 Tax=uncultured Desulfosarcina sp. TaxID=218289 RepID=UPI0029C7555A|nr:glycosyltransferase family 4 protein [uncultured Desulfosarcina sp.]
MKVIQLSHSDANGGAARAAYRIHHCLRDAGIDSRMWVNQALAGDVTVQGPLNKREKQSAVLRGHVGGLFKHIFKTGNPIMHSPAIFPSRWVKRVNTSDADIVHLHWIAEEMLSVADIGRIQKPIVWTLHDMWAFCGAEHLAMDTRWRDGYRHENRPPYESGFDLNRWTWLRKHKHWQRPIHIVTPSRWLADCARESKLMHNWPISMTPNPIDTERWKPITYELARELLGLPVDVPLLLFGAIGGVSEHHKGFDLLLRALEHLQGEPHVQGLELVVFGQRTPQSPPRLGFPIHFTGHLHDDLSLRALYSAANALVIPSRQDNLPNTGIEAQACATPVIAFNIGGLPDIVVHQQTGYLAKGFDTQDLARGIVWVLAKRKTGRLGKQAREQAVARFSYPVIAEKYRQIYEQYEVS